MIRIMNLTKRFDEKEAISSLSLDIGPGITGLVGQNGAGKSTLFRLISGVYEADEGETGHGGDHREAAEPLCQRWLLRR